MASLDYTFDPTWRTREQALMARAEARRAAKRRRREDRRMRAEEEREQRHGRRGA